MNVKLIIGTILAGLAVVFIVQNVTVMDLRFLFWKLSMSRALLMFLILSVGIILGWLLHGSFNRRKSNAHAKQEVVAGKTIA
ncbi:MAG: LapA family protein [Desulfobacteraceae bacterium]|nr:MAG: LapA family protein [Desulfobacteraceae bacterium]